MSNFIKEKTKDYQTVNLGLVDLIISSHLKIPQIFCKFNLETRQFIRNLN